MMISQITANLIKKAAETLQREGVFEKFHIPKIQIEHPREKAHGDYSSNIAMEIRKYKRGKIFMPNKAKVSSPMKIAAALTEKLKSFKETNKLFSAINVIEPGFINFFLSKKFLIEELEKICRKKKNYGSSKEGKGKTIIIDYSSPNIAKLFGIGHLRSTIIGQAIYNLYKFLGWKCVGDNHLGDWGTQFGKLIYQLEKDKLKGKTKEEKYKILKNLSIGELEELYVKFHREAVDNPELKEKAKNWFKKLEKNNKEAKKIWKILEGLSLKEFDRIYKLLEIKIDYAFGESFYRKMARGIIKEAKKKKIAVKSQGALIINYSSDKLPPSMLLKSDGTTTYFTRDLAAVKYRLKRWRPNLILYEVGADQSLYFRQLFSAIKLFGWINKKQPLRFVHIAHGLIRFESGKFSTRQGKTIHLENVLEEAIKRAGEIISKSETNRGLSEKEMEGISKAVGIGAIKYNDLSQHYSKNIIFDWNKILNLKGNSGPYIQYTFARCQSVIGKSKIKKIKKIKYNHFNYEEENVLKYIHRFPETAKEAAERFSPNLICNFAFNLAQKYNLFYNLHPIIKADNIELKTFRIALTIAVGGILETSLSLLGISAPRKM